MLLPGRNVSAPPSPPTPFTAYTMRRREAAALVAASRAIRICAPTPATARPLLFSHAERPPPKRAISRSKNTPATTANYHFDNTTIRAIGKYRKSPSQSVDTANAKIGHPTNGEIKSRQRLKRPHIALYYWVAKHVGYIQRVRFFCIWKLGFLLVFALGVTIVRVLCDSIWAAPSPFPAALSHPLTPPVRSPKHCNLGP